MYRVADCGVRRGERHFAGSRGSEWSERARRLDVDEREVVGNVLDVGQSHDDEVVVFVLVEEVFGEREADALRDTAVLLAVDYEVVVDDADVADEDEFLAVRLAGVHVDGDHREVDGEHVEAEGLTEAGVFIVAGADFSRAVGVEYLGLRVAFVEGRDALGDHLVVGAVCSVGLAHRIEQLVAAVDDALPTMTWQRLAAAAPLFGAFAVSERTSFICSGRRPSGLSASCAVPMQPMSAPCPWSSQVL